MPQPTQPVVLLVDDEPALLSVFTSGLTHAGFRVIAAQNADAAFQRASQQARVDVLATDLFLPGALHLAKDHLQRPVLHGIVLTRRLLALQPHLKVVLFSGQIQEPPGLGGLPPDTAFLRKPFSTDTLLRTIRHVLRADRPT